MKIVQSFWSCNRDLLKNRFGWVSPQYHLMAWTLSCLKLREHYEDLHLYTDTKGYEILIEHLNLPYKTAEICYDDIPYEKNLWGVTKILTYAKQNEPFIHVDGDVFLWDKFSTEIESAELIAQNFEIGTDYSNSMIEELLKQLKQVPNIVKDEISKESISSYNAGILGGSDIAFFKNYAREALNLVNKNPNIAGDDRIFLNFNILFEQILFFVLSSSENKKVTCYFDEPFKDNGYLIPIFSDFSRIALGQKYFHLIGGSKRNKSICELMSTILLRDYPAYFFKIIALFPDRHNYFDSKIVSVAPHLTAQKRKTKDTDNQPSFKFPRTKRAFSLHEHNTNDVMSTDTISFMVNNSGSLVTKEVFDYEISLSNLFDKWSSIPANALNAIEYTACHYFDFFALPKKDQFDVRLRINPFLEIIEDSFAWLPETKTLINTDIGLAPFEEFNGIACIPRLFSKGYDEILIDGLDYNMMLLLKTPLALGSLLKELEPCFTTEEIKDDYAAIYELMLRKLKHLFHSKCLFIENSFQLSN